MPNQDSRRSFLKSIGVLGAGAAVSVVPAEAAPRARRRARGGALGEDDAYVFFTEPEAAFVEAAVARLIPADELGPGAREAGVAYFIDGQLDGAYGAFAKNYGQGPWADGTPEQGYQLRLTPREVYRRSIRDVDDYWVRRTGRPFAEIGGELQDGFLRDLEAGEVRLADTPASVLARFWELLRANTVEGYFADPAYGGNAGMAAWEMVGFPGVVGEYEDLIEDYGAAYARGPVSLGQVQRGEVDAGHGHGHGGGGPQGMATVTPQPRDDHGDGDGDGHGDGGHDDGGGHDGESDDGHPHGDHPHDGGH